MSEVRTPPRRRNRWIVGGGLAVLALTVAAGCLGVVTLLSAARTYSHFLRADAADRTRLTVEATGTSVFLSPGTDSDVRVEAIGSYTGTEPAVAIGADGDTVAVTAVCRGDCSLRLRVTVPAGLAARVGSGTGAIEARGLGGPLDLRTTTGTIGVTGSGGPLTLRSGSGSVTVSDSRSSRVSLISGSGGVRADFAASPHRLDVVTGDGGVDLTLPKSTDYAVDAHSEGTTTPLISLPVKSSATHAVRVRTDNGGIRIH
ncbi:DUF4097 family beta strand repeat-containing protein [Streptomyces sp. NPDC059002]|uniref:DUF4097 family beta strand repeat-containing protein n=1 Tax=Streptomyces sp. NPDC059002 TaxID=3346690 RepID=UPI003686B59B